MSIVSVWTSAAVEVHPDVPTSAVFPASPPSSYLTGQSLRVNGS